MKKLTLIKMHTQCTDAATGITGTISGAEIDKFGFARYSLHPKGLNPDTGLPLAPFPVEAWRLNVEDDDYEQKEVPCEQIGKVVTDNVSGYTGMVTHIVIHLNGCMHYVLQANGKAKDGGRIRAIEVDPRSCGDAVVPPKQPPSPGEAFPERGFGAS